MCYIAEDQDNMSIKNRVKKEEYQLVLITFEMLLDNKQWRKMLRDEVYSECLCTVVLDEAHTVRKW